jgi:hypothetical protein
MRRGLTSLILAQALALAAPAEMFHSRYACGHLLFLPALEVDNNSGDAARHSEECRANVPTIRPELAKVLGRLQTGDVLVVTRLERWRGFTSSTPLARREQASSHSAMPGQTPPPRMAG